MADLLVHHSLSSRVAVKFNTNIRQYTLKGTEGDHKWVVEVGTTYPDSDGNDITPRVIYNIEERNIDEEISKVVADMCKLIDWGTLERDDQSPEISSYEPEGTSVSVRSHIKTVIKENLPSAGIDLSAMKVTFNNGEVDFDITSEINVEGDPYLYSLEWEPPEL